MSCLYHVEELENVLHIGSFNSPQLECQEIELTDLAIFALPDAPT